MCFSPNACTIEQVNELYIVLAHGLRQHNRHKVVSEGGSIKDIEINRRKLQWGVHGKHRNRQKDYACPLSSKYTLCSTSANVGSILLKKSENSCTIIMSALRIIHQSATPF